MGQRMTETGPDMANAPLTTNLTLRWPLLVENMWLWHDPTEHGYSWGIGDGHGNGCHMNANSGDGYSSLFTDYTDYGDDRDY